MPSKRPDAKARQRTSTILLLTSLLSTCAQCRHSSKNSHNIYLNNENHYHLAASPSSSPDSQLPAQTGLSSALSDSNLQVPAPTPTPRARFLDGGYTREQLLRRRQEGIIPPDVFDPKQCNIGVCSSTAYCTVENPPKTKGAASGDCCPLGEFCQVISACVPFASRPESITESPGNAVFFASTAFCGSSTPHCMKLIHRYGYKEENLERWICAPGSGTQTLTNPSSRLYMNLEERTRGVRPETTTTRENSETETDTSSPTESPNDSDPEKDDSKQEEEKDETSTPLSGGAIAGIAIGISIIIATILVLLYLHLRRRHNHQGSSHSSPFSRGGGEGSDQRLHDPNSFVASSTKYLPKSPLSAGTVYTPVPAYPVYELAERHKSGLGSGGIGEAEYMGFHGRPPAELDTSLRLSPVETLREEEQSYASNVMATRSQDQMKSYESSVVAPSQNTTTSTRSGMSASLDFRKENTYSYY